MKGVSPLYLSMALLLGVSYFISTGFAFSILLTAAFLYLAYRNTDSRDRKFVIFTISAAIFLRIALFILLQYKCISLGKLDILGDAQDNIIQGFNISDAIRNMQDIPVTLQSIFSSRYNTHSKTLFNGVYFLLFDSDMISLKYLNILAVSAAAWMIYDMTRRIYSSGAGRTALVIILFWPTILIWSLTDLKESHLILALVSTFWLLEKSSRQEGALRKAVMIAAAVLSALYFVFLKIKLMLPIFAVSAGIIICYNALVYGFRRNARLTRRLLYASAIPAALAVARYADEIAGIFRGAYALILHYHIGFLNSGGWNIDLLGGAGSQDYFTVAFFLKYMAKAWFYFFFEPMPWHFYSYSLMSAYPMLIVWYLLVAFSVLGLIRLHDRHGIRDVFAILVFSFIYVTVVGMSVANIGTIIRFRDVIVPVVAMFAAIGLSGKLEERCRKD